MLFIARMSVSSILIPSGSALRKNAGKFCRVFSSAFPETIVETAPDLAVSIS
ncbi:Uncharacterized protein EbC_27970 [Erwinia billingiae Eb661]|uniref:Uncharacterized protein n=1 Tax=Erwinia billingiae (strain Eb661) TaxID=634500 RepID=D8MU21_ERWBE|nr:Uncharacterized protein EbC_27970 [Erwinia billingiae Eb661]